MSFNVADEISRKILLSDIVRKDVAIELKGKEYVGHCPFHLEKTASFFINDEKGIFHCFGCGISGNIFNYVMRRDGITFHQALKKLADLAGIKISEPITSKYNELYRIFELATCFFESNKQVASSYITTRGINGCNQFRIGYAPSGDGLYRYLVHNGCNTAEIEASGLFSKKYTKHLCSRFQNRIIFPIFDNHDHVIAFGGRTIINKEPKYLNSPETAIFLKHKTLFAFNFAVKNVSKKHPFIVVEGYIDVITMHKYGFNTTVGTMGTALSVDHLNMLWKYSNEPIICMDGDKAGRKAMKRIAHLALRALSPGYSVRFCILPEGVDPDVLVKSENTGASFMHNLLAKSLSLSAFLWQEYVQEINNIENIPEKIALWETEIFKELDCIPDNTVKKLYKSEFSKNIYSYRHNNRTHTAITVKHENIISHQPSIDEYVLSYILVSKPNIIPSVIEKLLCVPFANKSLEKLWKSVAMSDDISNILKDSKNSELIASIIECGSKYYHLLDKLDDEILSDWLYIYEKTVSKQIEKVDLTSAMKEFRQVGTQTSWDRLRALKMYSLLKGRRKRVEQNT